MGYGMAKRERHRSRPSRRSWRAVQVGAPCLHHCTTPVQQVRACVRGLGLVADGMRESGFGDLARLAGVAAPVAEARAETVRNGFDARALDPAWTEWRRSSVVRLPKGGRVRSPGIRSLRRGGQPHGGVSSTPATWTETRFGTDQRTQRVRCCRRACHACVTSFAGFGGVPNDAVRDSRHGAGVGSPPWS